MRLETDRLVLRPWEDRDRGRLAAILGDPIVRRYYPHVLTQTEVDAEVNNAIAKTRENGFHLQAVELRSDKSLIGLLGLAKLSDLIRRAIVGHPEVEIGWQLDKAHWGKGYAPEAARAWLEFAWTELALPEVIAYTAEINLPSQRVMEKLGMVRDRAADFDHPKLPEGHALRRHVVYRIANPGC